MNENKLPNPVSDSSSDSQKKSEETEVATSTKVSTKVKKKKFPLFIILFLLLILGAGGFGAFKWQEYQTLQNFANLHNQLLVQEMNNIASINKSVDELFYQEQEKSDEKKEEQEKPAVAEILANLNKIQSNLAIMDDRQTESIKLLEKNQKEYQAFLQKNKTWLIKDKLEFVAKMVNTLDKYYQAEIGDIKNHLIYSKLSINQLELHKDSALFADFMEKTKGLRDKKAVDQYFKTISSLEKYTRQDFAYEEEEKIKQSFPYAYESLEKQRQFYKNFYLAIRDLVAGDEESAYYKLSRMGDSYASLGTIDEDRIESEAKKLSTDLKRSLAEALIDRLVLIEEFSNQNMGNYFLLGSVNNWQTDLASCYAVIYKNDLYQTVQSAYPQGVGNLSELLNKLDQISPSTDEISKYLTEDNVKFSADEKYIYFTCKDHSADKEYNFKYKDQQKVEDLAKEKEEKIEKN